jgi:hypothetical protein
VRELVQEQVDRAGWNNLAKTITLPLTVLLVFWTAAHSRADLWSYQLLLLWVLADELVLGIFVWTGYAAIALSVGFWRILQWPWMIFEVDVAPNRTNCNLKVFSDLRPSATTAFRHGIYDYAEVQAEVASIIRSIGRPGEALPDYTGFSQSGNNP